MADRVENAEQEADRENQGDGGPHTQIEERLLVGRPVEISKI